MGEVVNTFAQRLQEKVVADNWLKVQQAVTEFNQTTITNPTAVMVLSQIGIDAFLEYAHPSWQSAMSADTRYTEKECFFRFGSRLLGQEPKDFFRITQIGMAENLAVMSDLREELKEALDGTTNANAEVSSCLTYVTYAVMRAIFDSDFTIIDIAKTEDPCIWSFRLEAYGQLVEIELDHTVMVRDEKFLDEYDAETGKLGREDLE